jgi:hypothetical protein
MREKNPDIIEMLNPCDSFTLAMDEEIRKDGLSGSYGCFALELNGLLDIEALQQRIAEFSQRFPTSTASLQQHGRRFFWCKRAITPQLFFQHIITQKQSESDFLQQKIDQIINHKQERELINPIEFHLISGPTKQIFFTRWIHPFCDAKGIDLIIHFLSTDDAEQRLKMGQESGKALFYQQLKKYTFLQKLCLLLKAKRYMNRLDSLKSIQAFDSPNTSQRLNYSIQRLKASETELVLKQARKQVGLTGTSLYFIGCLMRALDKLNPENQGDAYCSPYAFNLRKQRVLTPITGNHVCALFAQAPREIVKDRNKLFIHLKQQNINVIRQQLDYAFLPLMWTGSWLSLDEYGKTLRLSFGSEKERSSFWFSDIGRLDINTDNQFLGATIKDVFHICQVTSPPALAFLSCIFNGRLTLSYNFVEPHANPEQIKTLHQFVLAELLAEN